MPKFLIFTLPRCRSYWISQYLSYGRARCGHDVALGCRSVDEFMARLRDFDGSVETGTGFGWRILHHLMPDVKISVVRRPLVEVGESLERFGLIPDWPTLISLNSLLNECTRELMCHNYSFAGLTNRNWRAALFKNALGVEFDELWDHDLEKTNLQLDVDHLTHRLEINLDNTQSMLSDLSRRSASLVRN